MENIALKSTNMYSRTILLQELLILCCQIFEFRSNVGMNIYIPLTLPTKYSFNHQNRKVNLDQSIDYL